MTVDEFLSWNAVGKLCVLLLMVALAVALSRMD